MKDIIPLQEIIKKIFIIRNQRVMLDKDLAKLYGTSTKALVQAVKRNLERFPVDFMFQLSKEEFKDLRSQTVTSRWGGRRYPPYAFTEQGVAMLSSVLRSKRAIRVNIAIMRVFVKFREMISVNKKFAKRLEKLEMRSIEHDKKLKEIYYTIIKLIEGPEKKEKKKQTIGFTPPKRRDNDLSRFR
jgi:hypothetical protein